MIKFAERLSNLSRMDSWKPDRQEQYLLRSKFWKDGSNKEIDDLKKKFLELGKLWWEDSNQKIPINIFLREDFVVFKKTLKCLPKKDVKELWGPTLSLEENFQKRIKRRRIQLIRTDDK